MAKVGTIALLLVCLVVGGVIGSSYSSMTGGNTVTVRRTTTLPGSTLTLFVPNPASTGAMVVTTVSLSETATVTTTETSGFTGLPGDEIPMYCFSPSGNCDQLLITYINQATVSIHIMIYTFTLTDVENALINARNRGVEVKLVMDRSESKSSSSLYPDLVAKGFDVKIANVAGIMHDKVAIIDTQYVLEGSFNWSNAAVHSNAENLVVINNSAIAQAYEAQFQQLYAGGS